MAVIKWLQDKKNGVNNWLSLYTGALVNRLRRDKNLSDLNSHAEARKNLQLIGEVQDHWHDQRYLTKITKLQNDMNTFKTDLEREIDQKITQLNETDTRHDKEIKEAKDAIASKSIGVITVGTSAGAIRGMITDWAEDKSKIPPGWHICDGTGGTPDLKSDFKTVGKITVYKIMRL